MSKDILHPLHERICPKHIYLIFYALKITWYPPGAQRLRPMKPRFGSGLQVQNQYASYADSIFLRAIVPLCLAQQDPNKIPYSALGLLSATSRRMR